MIDFKNYERLTKRDWKTEYEIGVCSKDISAGECPVYNDCFKYLLHLAELEDMIEQGKLVEKSEPKTVKERVALELKQLEERQQKLYDFIQTSKFQELSSIQKDLLVQQNNIMVDYIGTLENRLGNWQD